LLRLCINGSLSFICLNCKCGKKEKCRGKITGDDWQKSELQSLYGKHFLSHINDKIKEMNEDDGEEEEEEDEDDDEEDYEEEDDEEEEPKKTASKRKLDG